MAAGLIACMVEVIDAPLLDYGFQPIINCLMRHPTDVALVTAMGGGVLLTTSLLVNATWNQPLSFLLSLCGIVVQGIAIGNFYSRQHVWREQIKPGVRNPLRYILTPIRLLTLLTSAIFSVMFTYAADGFDLSATLFVSGLACWTVTYYFES